MQMMPVPGTVKQSMSGRIVPAMVALLMAIGLLGLLAIALIAGKKHLEF